MYVNMVENRIDGVTFRSSLIQFSALARGAKELTWRIGGEEECLKVIAQCFLL